MSKDKPQLISRRRHYLYVLVFSVAVWLFVAMLIGEFIPVYIWVKCARCEFSNHVVAKNISLVIFGSGGIFCGFLFSLIFNRFIIVANSKPGDANLPLSRFTRYGKVLFGRRGLIYLFILPVIYLFGYLLTPEPMGIQSMKMYCAVNREDMPEIRQGIEKGFHPTSLLYHSVFLGKKGIAEYAIENGADVNAKNATGRTPLHNAVECRYNDIAELLISKGANVNIIDGQGHTPFDMVNKFMNNDIITLLRAHGAKTGEELRKEAKK